VHPFEAEGETTPEQQRQVLKDLASSIRQPRSEPRELGPWPDLPEP